MQVLSDQKNSTNVTSFDYKALSSKQRTIIQQCTGEIKERLRRTAKDVWEVGQKLVEVRSQLEYGQFDTWLSAEFGWSRRTAYNFINVYEAFSKNTNFAQLNIATSALYKLAAPSTPQAIRQEFLQKAKQGEKITHKSISEALTAKKKSAAPPEKPQASSSPPQQILKVIPQATVGSPVSEEQKPLSDEEPRQGELSQKTEEFDLTKVSSKQVATTSPIDIKSGCWYLFERINVLFCGDTALAEFSHRLPEATLALAVTTDDWDHDWLIEKASNLILLQESYLKEGSLEQIISLFSAEGDTIIMPWLPHVEMLAIAHRLKRRIVAGDRDPERCQKAIAQLGLPVKQLNLPQGETIA